MVSIETRTRARRRAIREEERDVRDRERRSSRPEGGRPGWPEPHPRHPRADGEDHRRLPGWQIPIPAPSMKPF